MSTTALKARDTGRVEPLVANPTIRRLRAGDGKIGVEELAAEALDPQRLAAWRNGRVRRAPAAAVPAEHASEAAGEPRLRRRTKLRLGLTLGRLLAGQVRMKVAMRFRQRRPVAVAGGGRPVPGFSQAAKLIGFAGRMVRYDRHVMRQCWRTLKVLRALGRRRIFLYGVGSVARIIRLLCRDCGMEIVAAARWGGFPSDRPWSGRVIDEAELARADEPVVIAAAVNVAEKVSRLQAAGVCETRIWRLA
jgi:hypothetical protein